MSTSKQETRVLYLFIDDERFPPDYVDGQHIGEGWNIARDMRRVQDFVLTHGIPNYISFDHDLGEDKANGFMIAKWLVNMHLDGLALFPADFKYYVHSQNPVGKANIEGLLDPFLEANL